MDKDSWQELLRQSITGADELIERFDVDEKEIQGVLRRYPMRINPYYLGLIKKKGDPIYRQVVPDLKETEDRSCMEDPLNEEGDSPATNITHRYPDRVLFLVNYECAIYCRFCTRKRKVGDPMRMRSEEIQAGLDYIRAHREIRDVLLSGGDPLLLGDGPLEEILKAVRAIPHVEIIRIGSRVPCALPQRITPELCQMLEQYHPLYINTHFNHPDEITPESKLACERLAKAGIPLGNQTVLLKGVNDDPEVLKGLFQKLLTIRVRPYYLYQADMVKGTEHFRTRVEKGLEIIGRVRGFTSGLAVPYYVIDAPGGGGKVPLLPEYVQEINEHEVILRNYRGDLHLYKQPDADEPEVPLELECMSEQES